MVGMVIGRKFPRKARLGNSHIPSEDELVPGGLYHQEGLERGLQHYPAPCPQVLSPPRFYFFTFSFTDSTE